MNRSEREQQSLYSLQNLQIEADAICHEIIREVENWIALSQNERNNNIVVLTVKLRKLIAQYETEIGEITGFNLTEEVDRFIERTKGSSQA